MIKASVYVICQDEERHIERMLKSVADFDEIIVVDSGSTDATLKIAKKYTDKIYFQKFLGYSEQKEFAKNLCKDEWVLNLDADEELSAGLKNEIARAIENDDTDAIECKIHSIIWSDCGGSISKFTRPIKRIRFFKKSLGYYPPKMVHESIFFKGRIKGSENFIYDYGITDIRTHIDKINAYSSLRAVEKAKKGKRASALKLIFVFLFVFVKSYFFRRAIFNGKKGFIIAMINAFYAFLKEAKLYENDLKNNNKI